MVWPLTSTNKGLATALVVAPGRPSTTSVRLFGERDPGQLDDEVPIIASYELVSLDNVCAEQCRSEFDYL